MIFSRVRAITLLSAGTLLTHRNMPKLRRAIPNATPLIIYETNCPTNCHRKYLIYKAFKKHYNTRFNNILYSGPSAQHRNLSPAGRIGRPRLNPASASEIAGLIFVPQRGNLSPTRNTRSHVRLGHATHGCITLHLALSRSISSVSRRKKEKTKKKKEIKENILPHHPHY